MTRVVIYGGSFNPPTLAHREVVRLVAECVADVRDIFVVPTYEHAYGKELISFRKRMELCDLAFANIDPRVRVASLDKIVQSEPRGSMFSIIQELRRLAPSDAEFAVVVGQDQAEEIIPRWFNGQALIDAVDLLVVPRAGNEVGTAKCPWLFNTAERRHQLLPQLAPEFHQVSSTVARAAFRDGITDILPDVLQDDVITYCTQRKLYND